MHAVILAGGKGTRLHPFTVTIPKPLLPLGDLPVLEVVIRQLAAAGFDHISLTLNHMAPLFNALLGDGSQWGVKLEYILESEPLGTAGSLRLVSVLQDHLLVMNGDVLTTLDFADFFSQHVKAGALASIAIAKRNVQIDYGVIDVGDHNSMAGYREKPTLDYCVSMGIYMLTSKALEFLPSDGFYDMPSLMLAIHNSGGRVYCYCSDCYWQDIGRMEDYQRASEDFVHDDSRFLSS